MEVTSTPKPEASQVELVITIPAKDFAVYLSKAAKDITATKPLPGFRPGTAPVDVVVKNYGEHAVLHAAMDAALPNIFVRAIMDEGLEAIGRPAITVQELALDKPFVFTALVAVMPKVELGDPTTLKATKREATVTEEDIERELKQLANMRATYLQVAAPAQKGDTALIDFKVSMNGEVIEGGESKNHPINIGEGHFVPGFEEKLEGMSAGDERDFSITFPSDYGHEQYRDKTAQVWVKAHAVHKKAVPELNDEFATKVGKFDNLAHLKGELSKNMQDEKDKKEHERIRGDLSEQLAAASTFGPLPDVLIDREIDHRLQELNQFLSYQGKTIDDYLKDKKQTIEEVRAELKEPSLQSIKVALALRAFADKEKLDVEKNEIEEKVLEYLQRFKTTQQAGQEVDPDQLRDDIGAHLRTQKALEHLEKVATVETEVTEEKK